MSETDNLIETAIDIDIAKEAVLDSIARRLKKEIACINEEIMICANNSITILFLNSIDLFNSLNAQEKAYILYFYGAAGYEVRSRNIAGTKTPEYTISWDLKIKVRD